MPINRTRKRHKSFSSFTKKQKQGKEKPYVPPENKSINPGNDFYNFVNVNWQRHIKMPPFLTSYGVSEEIEDIINEELLKILKESQKQVQSNPDEKLLKHIKTLGTFTESILNNRVQDENIKSVRSFISRINCVRDKNEIGLVIGQFIKYRINTLIFFTCLSLETKSTSLKLALLPGKLSLPDSSYYLNKSQFNINILKSYSSLLKKLGSDFGISNLETILSLEQMAAEPLQSSNEDKEVLMKGETLLKKYKYIPIEFICKSAMDWSKSKVEQHSFLIISPRWMNNLNKWFRTIPLDIWKKWLIVNCLMYLLPLLPPPYDDMEFELFGKKMRGQTQKVPQYRLALQSSKEWLSGTLGQEYIKYNVTKEIKEKAENLAKEIKESAKDLANSTPWLDKATREKAKEKVDNIYLGVGYPKDMEDESNVKLHPEKFLENVFALAAYDFENDMKKINTILDVNDWDDPVFSVNAYYYNGGNRLILPAGILRWPFYNEQANDGWNFGGLGATIGHEICHAFDNDGKNYDEEGNKKPWWTKGDITRYNKKTKALVDLYSKTKYFSQPLNGYLTLSENIADLGGLGIALNSLKKRLEKKGVSKVQYKKELCDFFISYAVSWRTKEKRQKALQGLFMDVHSPPIARVNNIVCQFDEWYECFDVKPGDVLYKAPEERIRIF